MRRLRVSPPKLVLLLVFAVVSALHAQGYKTPFQKLELEIQKARADRANYLVQRKTITDPRLLEETDQVIASLAELQIKWEADLKKLQARVDTRRPCPICGGKLATVGSIPYDRAKLTKPFKNLAVWNGSMCGDTTYIAQSPVCTHCWFAMDIILESWDRSSHDRNSFFHPLTAAIRDFPIPANKTEKQFPPVYSQRFEGEKRWEEVSFLCDGWKEDLDRAQAFAREHGLKIRMERLERVGTDVHVSTEK